MELRHERKSTTWWGCSAATTVLAVAAYACVHEPAVSTHAAALVSAPACYDPTDLGAVPNDGLDDRVPFQAAIDAAAAAPEGGTICIPPGRFTFPTRAPLGSYNRFAVLSTHGRNITIRGAGPETVLELTGDQGGSTTILISVDPSAEHIRVTGLRMVLSATNTDEQTHAVATTGVCSTALGLCQPIRDVEIDHVQFAWGRVAPAWRTGDAIRLLGNTVGTELFGARIHDNSCNTGRACITVQRGVHAVLISGNSFYCDACDQLIDGEATGVILTTGQPTDLTIVANTFDRGPLAQGDHDISMTSAARMTIAGNTLLHGGITLYRSTGVTVTGNTIEAPTMTGDEGVLQVANACDGLVVSGNTIRRGGHVGPVVKLVPHSGTVCAGVTLGPDTLIQGTPFQAVYAESLSRTSIVGNTIVYPPPGANGFPAIENRAVYSDAARQVTAFSVTNNVISGSVTYAVDLHASPGFYGKGVLVSNNTADNATFGLRCDGPAANFTAVVTSGGNSWAPSAYGNAVVEHGD